MYRRKLSRALSHREVRDLVEATHFAEKRGKPLTATLNVNPSSLDNYPADLGRWLTAFLNKLRIWCERAGFGYFAIWVRENYVGTGREHLHVLLYVPDGKRSALNKALTYMLKQMTPQAWAALGREVRREKHCRHTGEAVAPVMGKRCGVSRSLNERTRRTFWSTPVVKTVEASRLSSQDKAA